MNGSRLSQSWEAFGLIVNEALREFFLPVTRTYELFHSRHGWWVVLTFLTFVVFCILRESAETASVRLGICIAFTPVFTFELVALSWFGYRLPRAKRIKQMENELAERLSRTVNELLLLASEVATEERTSKEDEARQLDLICRQYLLMMSARSGMQNLPLADVYSERLRKMLKAANEASVRLYGAHRELSGAAKQGPTERRFVEIGKTIASAGRMLDLAIG